MPDLKDLRDKRDEILKAELAAWLHDVGKCADTFLQPGGMGFDAQNCQGKPRVNPHKAVFSPQRLAQLSYWSRLSPNRGQCARLEEANHPTALWKTLNQISAQIPSLNVALKGCGQSRLSELILWGRPLVSDRFSQFKNVLGVDLTYLAGILGKAHGAAHMEKEDIADGGQSPGNSSPFGWYIKDFANLNDKLKTIIQGTSKFPKERCDAIKAFRVNMQEAPGDTRRPINEVTLWDWSSIVAALYKAEIARCVLTGEQRDPDQVQWRLLSIRTDGLEYLLSANSIPDLLARKDLLTDAWNRVQTLLEEIYPLGLEVYRDENGPVFVVPDIEGLLGLTDPDHNNQTLREFILKAFRQGTVKDDQCLALAGEIVPYFKLDKKAWDGQSKLPPIGKDHLKETPPLQADPQWVAEQWCNLPKPQERCTVCSLRPQGPSKKARDRGMCDVCEKRREDRAKEWAANIGRGFLSTIWLDEVADQNGRIALIVVTFGLDHWLDGTLVRSLAVRNPENCGKNNKNCPQKSAEYVAKNPSFARLRRIWETTRRFWQETLKETEHKLTKRSRLFLKGSVPKNSLGPYHAYELEIQGRRVAVLWVPEDATDENGQLLKYRGGFWVIENLDYLSNVYGRSFQNIVQDLVGQSLKVYEPTEYGQPGKARATFILEEPTPVENAYLPLIPILAEPRTLMVLVPAESTFDLLMAIKTKYEREMGKVRNRLPLHLGVIFAGRKMPLRAVMDAGKRMLRQKAKPELWEVMCSARKQIDKEDKLPEEFKGDKDGQFKEWYEVTLRNSNHQITWYVPAVMGDGQTEDRWYPYVLLASPNEPKGRKRYYRTDLENPWNPAHPWLVHAAELQPGDKIYFTPATVDFEFLDYNIRRFEIYYEDGKRKGSLTKPYLLDEFPVLEKIWNYLTEKKNNKPRLSSSQIFALRNLIETKREEWFENPEDSLADENFKKFCKDLFVNAQWNWGKPDGTGGITFDKLANWAVRGWFTDAVYLFHHVMKEPKRNTRREEE